jgi:hypothetical protein
LHFKNKQRQYNLSRENNQKKERKKQRKKQRKKERKKERKKKNSSFRILKTQK